MHEEESVKRDIDAVIVRTGQLVLKPSQEFIMSLLRRVSDIAAQTGHGALITVTGHIPGHGETGLVSASTLHRLSRHGKGVVTLEDVDTRAFTQMMAKFKIPISVLTDAETQERYLEYRTEDEQAVLTGLKQCAVHLMEERQREMGHEVTEEEHQQIEELVEELSNPGKELSVENALKATSFEWEKVGTGYETSVSDDLGNKLHCRVDDTGLWRVSSDTGEVREGSRALCAGGEGGDSTLAESILNAAAAISSLTSAVARRQMERFSLKTPEEQRMIARDALEKSSGSIHDLGNRPHRGI